MNRFYECPVIAKQYSQYRPHYTDEIARRIVSFCEQSQLHLTSKLDLMIDVGCGSGQSTSIFQPYFKEIIGTDVSPEQLKQAEKQNKHSNIRYTEGSAEKIPAKNGSVDLVVVATAAHWFDLPKFYQEVKRVLKPKTGCVAIIGYHSPTANIISNPNENLKHKSFQLIKNYIFKWLSYQPKIKPAYEMSFNRYASIFKSLPFSTKTRDDSFYLSFHWSLDDLCHWMSSLDAHHFVVEEKHGGSMEACQENGNVISDMDPLRHFLEDFSALWQLQDNHFSEKLFEIDFNPFVLLAR